MLDDLYLETEMKMESALEATLKEMSLIRTGRANPAILDKVMVEAYGQTMMLKQLSTASTPDAHTILIKPFDKNTLGDIERGINKSDIGLSPVNDGNLIRLNVPPLTAERRQELVKILKNLAEDGRVSIRNARRDGKDAVKKAEKNKGITEDDSRIALENLQELTDKYIKMIDEAFEKKEVEITQLR